MKRSVSIGSADRETFACTYNKQNVHQQNSVILKKQRGLISANDCKIQMPIYSQYMPKPLRLRSPRVSFRLLQHMEVASSLFYRRKQHREGGRPGLTQKPTEEAGIQSKTFETQSLFCLDNVCLNLGSLPVFKSNLKKR